MSGLTYSDMLLLYVVQPWVTIRPALHSIVYRWPSRHSSGARGRYLCSGSYMAFEAVVDDFGNLVPVEAW